MNNISKTLIAMLLVSSVAPSFAQAAAKFEDVRSCLKIKNQAEAHSEWSDALDHLTSSNRLTDQQLHPIYKNSLKKIIKDIYKVRKLAEVTEDDRAVTVLDEADELLEKVKQDTYTTSKANELMKEKLFELDDEMFKTLRVAGNNIANCNVSGSGSSSTSSEDADSEDSVN